MRFLLPSDLNPGCGNGARPADHPEQIAQLVHQPKEFPVPEEVVYPLMPLRYIHSYLKPSELQVEVYLLEKIFSPSRAFLSTFQQDFRVQVETGEPDSEGKVKIRIMGNPLDQFRARKMIDFLIANSGRMAYVGSLMLSMETMKNLKRKNIYYRISLPPMEIYQQYITFTLLEIRHKTTRNLFPK